MRNFVHNAQRIRGIPRRLVFTMGFLSLTISLPASEPGKIEGRITRFDIATKDDLLFSRLVGPVMAGDTAEWSKRLLGGMPAQVGDWVNQFTDARTLASIVIEAFPVEGQDALKPIDTLVTECARTLEVDKPDVHVRNSPLTRAYTVRAGGRHHLVLTSALLNLFEDSPLELKFVVGRELGHIKCEHPELKRKSYAVLSTIQAIDVALVPDRCQNMLPLLALGRLLSWCRESEFSADRAGLLCCGEPKPAYEAIMRLQHGLRADSIWLDPEAKEFDPQAIIRSFRQWQYEPFIKFILYLKKQPLEHPYYQERLAMLKAWVDSGTHQKILERGAGPIDDQLIEVLKIQAFELAEEGQTADPYVVVRDGDRQVLRTRYAAAVREAEWSGFRSTDTGVEQPRSFRNGQPLFFEIWDRNYVQDTFIGGFVIYPDGRDAKVAEAGESLAQYTGKILWDWNEPQTISRPGYARVMVRFSRRQTETPLATEKEPGQ
jgi:Zn-dependent protease with chaperone function